MRKCKVTHNLGVPITGHVNNVTYLIPPGSNGVILTDQKFTVEQIVESLQTDFNNASPTKVNFAIEEIPEPIVEEPALVIEEPVFIDDVNKDKTDEVKE